MFTLRTKGITEEVSLRNLPTLRQSFIVASIIIIVAFILAHVLHPDFVYLALLPAFGLMFSGLTGFCPMAYFLQLLPGNKS
jgi:hypothetical protein